MLQKDTHTHTHTHTHTYRENKLSTSTYHDLMKPANEELEKSIRLLLKIADGNAESRETTLTTRQMGMLTVLAGVAIILSTWIIIAGID
eukprot:GHVR01133765.1.p1 GENE.GHVR01133765.1~~GHVR01133765.1.p1  ORF type:complete len:101 (-),score=60.57 GHVR01133765.1:199-465(-)